MLQPINELRRFQQVYEVGVFDPDLMYVECKHCGRPVLWSTGRTSEILKGVDVARAELDASCMILTHGCPRCEPGERQFRLQIIRVDGGYADEAKEQLLAHA